MTYQQFVQTFHIQLNPQQEAAVRQTEGPVLLLAVPGSGKTTVLVTRLGYLLYCRGVAPEQILTVTYTRAATQDMALRFAARFSRADADRLEFRTINGLCAKIIAYYARVTGARPFTLAEQDGQLNALLRDLLIRGGCPFPGDQQIKDARTQITYCKNMLLSNQEIRGIKLPGMDFPALFDAYQQAMRTSRLMDYDDQMVFAYRILRQYPEILAAVQRRYRYFCVDEAQDTSKIQHAILDLLAQESGNLFMVGDEDQSIYGFRAAWPQALLEFEAHHPGAHILLMETNYRSTPAIVAGADAFIRRNQSRRPKQMRTSRQGGGAIRRRILEDYGAQSSYLLSVAREAAERASTTAILFRNNDSALPLVDLLEREGIAYRYRQREGLFFSSPIVRDLTGMLRFSFRMEDAAAFQSFYYKLDLKLKRTLVTRLLGRLAPDQTVFEALLESEELEPWQRSRVAAMQAHFSKLPQRSSFSALMQLVRRMGYGEYLKAHYADIARLDILLALAQQNAAPEDFLRRLDALRACTARGGETDRCGGLTLSTIHASKGLEYERVLLIDAADGIFPGTPPDGTDAGTRLAALEEERRLFYVGITRARSQLELITYRNRFGEEGPSFPFVDQLLGEDGPERRQPTCSRSGPGPRPLRAQAAVNAVQAEKYQPGVRVCHRRFGPGEIATRDGDLIRVFFDNGGHKKLQLSHCLKKGLLTREHDG